MSYFADCPPWDDVPEVPDDFDPDDDSWCEDAARDRDEAAADRVIGRLMKEDKW